MRRDHMPDITILHTNDFHGKMTPLAQRIIAREKAASPNPVLLDAGDAVSSGNIYYRPGGEPILARMTEVGYDAMAMGNREFHFLAAGLRSKVRLAHFPVLSANLRDKAGEIGPTVSPYVIMERDGVKIAVFGLCVPMITKQMRLASSVSPYWFEDPIETAASLVPQLRGTADIVVALTHIGIKRDLELADSVEGIDIIVGGHSHSVLPEPLRIGGATVAQTGWWGHCLGRLNLSFSSSGVSVTGSLIDLRAEPG
jgi:5'-nucleotidase